jgi:acyl transferase domain-containing protein
MPYLRESGESSPDEFDLNSIAVVGLSVRFPGEASTADKFWELLRKGRCKFARYES